MIEFDRVSVTYTGNGSPTLRDVDLRIAEGELCLVAGHTGSGKSTLLGAVNGLVPHFTGGTLAGRVLVDGRDTARHRPRDLADVVGMVGQDPAAGFVTDTVEDELAYTMEQLAVPASAMRRRVEEILDLLGLADLRRRALHALSGGQQQRIAIGAALAASPRILVLDEPTSALDPIGAEDVLAAITRLVHDLGVTVLLAEHRLERVLPYADSLVYVREGTVTVETPQRQMAHADAVPPIIELGRLADWDPLPLSVRDARRAAEPLRGSLPATPPRPHRPKTGEGATELKATGVIVRHGPIIAVRGIDLKLRSGEVVGLMGRNGSGKSSLLWALAGAGKRAAGQVLVAGQDPAMLSAARARSVAALVPQTPADLLYLDTVEQELSRADRVAHGRSAGSILNDLAPGLARSTHPRDLSAGQQLALVLAIQLSAAPRVLLLDEPTRGLDYAAKRTLTGILDRLVAAGHAVLVATHDVEFAARTCDRVAVMAEGEFVADGPAATVLTASPAFAPQVAKILAPAAYLTTDQVADALAGAAR
jgi:energy-coupling factor transport system ATP-binding protein